MSEETSRFREESLLVERIADILGFSTVAARIPWVDVYPPYLFVAFFLFLDHGILQTYIHVTGGTHVLVTNPLVSVGVVAVFVGVFGIKYMSDGYARAIVDSRLKERATDDQVQQLEEPVSLRVKTIVFTLAVAVLYANIFLGVGLSTILELRTGALPVHLVNWLFVFEFVYLPVVVEFGLVYYSIHFVLPHRIRKLDVPMFFYDPRNMGGYAAVGELLKRSYYLYTAGLLGFFLLVYSGVLLGTQGGNVTGVFEFVFFTAAWGVGLVSIGHSMYTMHQVMTTKKRQRIKELEAEMRELIENPDDINASRVPDEERLRDIERRIDQVRETREYPSTFTMWSQIAISVLLPQLLQLAVQTAF